MKNKMTMQQEKLPPVIYAQMKDNTMGVSRTDG